MAVTGLRECWGPPWNRPLPSAVIWVLWSSMEFTKMQTQPLTCFLTMGSPRLWTVPEAEMRDAPLSGLDLFEGPPWSCDSTEGYVWSWWGQGWGGCWWPVLPISCYVVVWPVPWPWAVLIFVGLCCSWDHVDVGDLCYLPETVVLAVWVPVTTEGQVWV